MGKTASFIHSRVARRIFLLFVLCAFLPVCLLALLSLHGVSSWLRQESSERLRQVGKNAGMTVLEGMTLLREELESMDIPSGDGARRSTPVSRIGKDRRFLAVNEMKVDESGRIPGMLRPLSASELSHLADGNSLIIANGEFKGGAPLYMVTYGNRNLPKGNLLVGEIDPAYLWTLVGYTLPSGMDICVLGPTGKAMFETVKLPSGLASRVIASEGKSSTGQFQWQGGEEDYLVNYWSVFMKPEFLADSWSVVVVQAKGDSLGPVLSFRKTFLLVVMLAMFVVIFVSSVLIRRNLGPLSILKDGALRLSGGDFATRVEISSGDEFEDLADSFNDMSAELAKQFGRLGEMGRLVRRILAAHDRDTVIDVVMSDFRGSVPCDLLAISLMDENNAFQAKTSYNSCSGAVPGSIRSFEAQLEHTELESIRVTDESLHVKGSGDFASILAPLAAEWGGEFFLFPISIRKRLLGILILGYREAIDEVRDDMLRARQIAGEIAIALDNVRLIDELSILSWGTIETLANAVDAKSPWTAGHSERVTRLALEIGKEMGVSGRELDLLHWGGLFHDMGKIGVPEYILDKPGKLTDEEFAIIRKHPEKGAEILEPIRAYKEAIPIVAQHHERFDGKGYPRGLAGEGISLGARILAVADVFDALHSDRPYREGWEIGKVISYMEENSGSSFDPDVVRALMRVDRAVYLEPTADESLLMNG